MKEPNSNTQTSKVKLLKPNGIAKSTKENQASCASLPQQIKLKAFPKLTN